MCLENTVIHSYKHLMAAKGEVSLFNDVTLSGLTTHQNKTQVTRLAEKHKLDLMGKDEEK